MSTIEPREITSHLAGDDDVPLTLHATDEPGAGGANQRYDITGFDTDHNPSRVGPEGYISSISRLPVIFQRGPVDEEKGPNGITVEVLLAIVEDRLVGFQSGPYPCEENDIALVNVRAAKAALHARARTPNKTKQDEPVE